MKLSVIIPVFNQEALILKAIKSIPSLSDIEVIVVDDGSTDGTLEELRLFQMYSKQNLIIISNKDNLGVGVAVNKGLDFASGEYVVLLGSDDYFTDLSSVMDELTGEDLIYFDLQINDGTIFHLDQKTKYEYCGSTKFMKRSFIGSLREPDMRAREDYFFYQELLKMNPTEKFLNRVVKHYNFPRKGSLTDKATNGEL